MVAWDEDEPTENLLAHVALRSHLAPADLDRPVHTRLVNVIRWSMIVVPAFIVVTLMKGFVVALIDAFGFAGR